MTAPTPDRSPVAPASVGEQIAAAIAENWSGDDVYDAALEDAARIARNFTTTVDDAAVDEAAGSWICGRCGDAPEGHTDANSKCVYDPTFRRSAIAIPRQNSLSGRAGEWFKAFAAVPTSPTEAVDEQEFLHDPWDGSCIRHIIGERTDSAHRCRTCNPTSPTVTPAASDDDNGLRAALTGLVDEWQRVSEGLASGLSAELLADAASDIRRTLAAHPAPTITDEMVERALATNHVDMRCGFCMDDTPGDRSYCGLTNGHNGRHYQGGTREVRVDNMRAALTAALNPEQAS